MAGSPYPEPYVAPGGRAAVVVRDLAAGTGVPWRRHTEEDLVHVVLEGEVVLETAEGAWTGVPHAVLHVPPGVAHRYRAVTRSRLLVVVLPAGAEQLLLHEERLAVEDPALLLALAQEHRVELLPGLLP